MEGHFYCSSCLYELDWEKKPQVRSSTRKWKGYARICQKEFSNIIIVY